VGECRGAEALDMLQAMNTGHDGSLSTGHANSPHDIISRIETMVLQGQDFPLNAIRQQIASGIDIIVQLGRLRDKSRRVLEVSEVDGFMDGEIVLHTLYRFEETGVLDSGRHTFYENNPPVLCRHGISAVIHIIKTLRNCSVTYKPTLTATAFLTLYAA
jgi:pilus assembly protein CpaF